MFKNIKKYSQTGEEGVLVGIFDKINTTNKYLVDFGAGDGISLSNTKLLLDDYGWKGLRLDMNATNDVLSEKITPANALAVFAKYDVPKSFDLLSVDIDGLDYWVIRELLSVYEPRVIVCEINGCLPTGISQTVAYNEAFAYNGDDYYGASLLAYKRLLKGYKCVHNQHNLNAFFVLTELVSDMPEAQELCTPYHEHNPHGKWHVNPELVEESYTLKPTHVIEAAEGYEQGKLTPADRIPADNEQRETPKKKRNTKPKAK